MDRVQARTTFCGTQIVMTIEGDIYQESPAGLTIHGQRVSLGPDRVQRDYDLLREDIVSIERNIEVSA